MAKGTQSRKAVLVTGAAGFIGSHVAAELVKRGRTVVGLDDLSGGFRENLPVEAHFVQGSVNDGALLSELFKEHEIEYVYHLAAYAAESQSHFLRHFIYHNNVLGSVRLINQCLNSGTVKCFVFTSSIAVYGRAPVPMTEDTPAQPMDPYGISKYVVEMELAAAREMFGLNSIVFRPHNVYGPAQHIGDPDRNVIGIFMKQALMGEDLTVVGDGTQTRAFSYISDVAPIIAHSVDHPAAYNQVFNIGADRPYSVIEIARQVCKAMGVKRNIRFIATRNEPLQAYCSHDKARAIFDPLFANVALEDGLAKMALWARQTGVRKISTSHLREVHLEPEAWAMPSAPRAASI
jgi:UDP-glucose 4-epimerase